MGMMLLLLLHRGVPNSLAVGGRPHRLAAAMSAGDRCKCAMSFAGNAFAGNAVSKTIDLDTFRECECLDELATCLTSVELETAWTPPSALGRGLWAKNPGCNIGESGRRGIGEKDLCGDFGCFPQGE